MTEREIELGKKIGELQRELSHWEQTPIGRWRSDLIDALKEIESQKDHIKTLRYLLASCSAKTGIASGDDTHQAHTAVPLLLQSRPYSPNSFRLRGSKTNKITEREIELGKKIGKLQREIRRWEQTPIGKERSDLIDALKQIESQKDHIKTLRYLLASCSAKTGIASGDDTHQAHTAVPLALQSPRERREQARKNQQK